MKHKTVYLFMIAIVCVLAAVLFVYFQNNQTKNNMLPSELREQLSCDRLTLDMKSTDKYCNDYKLYKKDHAAGKI